jgi:hypothetical protein
VTVPGIWAGVDIGKKHHHAVVINAEGERLLSRRVQNDETELLQLLADVREISDDVLWAVDINHGIAALLIGLLLNHDQPIAYLTGRAVHQAAATYRGEGKTDARDAFIIADQARVRRDVSMLRPGDEIAIDLVDGLGQPGTRQPRHRQTLHGDFLVLGDQPGGELVVELFAGVGDLGVGAGDLQTGRFSPRPP